MPMKSLFPLLLVSTALFLFSCKAEVDVEAPSLEVLQFDPAPGAATICGQPEDNVFFVSSGDTLQYDVQLRDNVALSQAKIDIHQNFDCHGHARATEDWTVLELIDLSGTEERLQGGIAVPADVTAGAYHFQIQVVDAAGNEDPFSNFYSIRVTNERDTIPPQLQVAEPTFRNFSASKGSDLVFSGTITDNYSLGEGGNGKLLLTYEGVSGSNTFEAFRLEFPESEGDRINFSQTFTIPPTLVADTYEFVLSAYDGVNNESDRERWEIEIN